jgi:hypothetical protein
MKWLCTWILLATACAAHAGFQDNDNNRAIESCRAGLQKFMANVPLSNDEFKGQNAGKPCYLRYFNVTESDNGKRINNGFVLTTYVDGGAYFSSMEVGMDRTPDHTGIHSIMNSCSVGSKLVQISTDYIDPYSSNRQEYAELRKDKRGRLVSARVSTNLADQTCFF